MRCARCLVCAGLVAAAAPAAADTAGPMALATPPPQIALIAHTMMETLRPRGTPTVTVYRTTFGTAARVLERAHGYTRGLSSRHVDVITVRGQHVSRRGPIGRELFGFTIWIPDGSTAETGVQLRPAMSLGPLGPGTVYALRAPVTPARELALRPGVGVGSVVLGEPFRRVQHALGPWLFGSDGGPDGDIDYALGPAQLDVGFQARRVQEMTIADPAVTLDDVPLDEGYTRLARLLPRWRKVNCSDDQRMLSTGGIDGPVTSVAFRGDRFVNAHVGEAGTGGCPPWPPSFLAEPVGE